MSAIPPKNPFSTTNPASSALNQSHLVSGASKSPKNDWHAAGEDGPLEPPLSGDLPPTKVHSTDQPGQSSRQLAQAALQYGNEYQGDNFEEDSLIQDYAAQSLHFEPPLSLNFGLGDQNLQNQQGSIGLSTNQAPTYSNQLEAEVSTPSPGLSTFQPIYVSPSKRRASTPPQTHIQGQQQPAKRTREVYGRARELASELEAPLPPANAILAANHHAPVPQIHSAEPSAEQLQPDTIASGSRDKLQRDLLASLAEIKLLQEQNHHLELQLFNRNEELARRVKELGNALLYIERAKKCMKLDGDSINHMRRLLYVSKRHMEGWLDKLAPLVVRESSTTKQWLEDEGVPRELLVPATTITAQAKGVIGTFEQSLADIIERPVDDIYGTNDNRASIRGIR
ncbi:hypothetical protein TWF481_008560 [Arthrobotrys musiformis]|uniref:BZIP domain-containing protein n=1 Tax=Arthrobotrys musiformis TaxID=47236 RepID=A0AAV9W7I9_9PEZI